MIVQISEMYFAFHSRVVVEGGFRLLNYNKVHGRLFGKGWVATVGVFSLKKLTIGNEAGLLELLKI